LADWEGERWTGASKEVSKEVEGPTDLLPSIINSSTRKQIKDSSGKKELAVVFFAELIIA
jgi:hypothetical protein